MLITALREVLDHLYDGIIVYAANGRVLEYNARALTILGVTAEELEGRTAHQPGWVIETLDGSASGPALLPSEVARATLRKVPSRELRVKSPEGVWRELAISAVPILGEAGELLQVVSIFADLTEVQARQAELAISREMLDRARDVARIHVSTLDPATGAIDLEVTSLTAALGVGTRLSISDVLGGVHPDDRAAAERLAADARAARASGPVDFRWRAPDDRYRSVRCWIQPMIDPRGRSTRMLVITQDVTESVELLAKLHSAERLAAMGALAAGVAHEINNPLTYTLANLELVQRELLEGGLADGPALARLRRAVDDARDGAERVRKIVADLRTFTRRGPPSTQDVDVGRALDVALTMAHNVLKRRVKVVRDPCTPPIVRGDESRVAQVFVNLLVHAAESPVPTSGSDLRSLRVGCRMDGPDVVIVITDPGRAMAAEQVAKIFDPFSVAPGGAGEHTGLGMFVTQGLVKELGGSIRVTSEVGRGTEYEVRFQRAGAAPEAAAAAPAPKRPRVLVVDDEPLVRQAIARLLGSTHEVVVAEGGAQALRALGSSSFDVVLCDLMMPEMSGIDIYERAGAERPRFVFMTGGVFTERAQDFLDAEHPAVLEKPFSLSALLSALQP